MVLGFGLGLGVVATGDAAVLCAKGRKGKLRVAESCTERELQVDLGVTTTLQSSCDAVTEGAGVYRAAASCDGVGTLVGGGGHCVTLDAQGAVVNTVGVVASRASGNAWVQECNANLDSLNLFNVVRDLVVAFGYVIPDPNEYNLALVPTVCAYALCATVSL